jgi:NADH dehydrogenase
MDRLVTIFGGSGFVGRSVVRAVARRGWRIRIAMRKPHLGYTLRPLADVGQLEIVFADFRQPESLAGAVDGAQGVINLVGVLHEGGGQSFRQLQAEGARRVAQLSAERGIERFVQMSALGAAADSRSEYARTKAQGEDAVRSAVPSAAILRPSIIFGPDDSFFNRFAEMVAGPLPALPLVGGGLTRFQPAYVGDVGQAAAVALSDPALGGRTYELGGPETYTFRQLLELVLKETGRDKPLVPLPWGVASAIGSVGQMMGKILPIAPPLTADQVELLRDDNVASGREPGFEALGLSPTAVEAVVPQYLWRFRKGGQFADITPQGFLSHRQH